MLHKEVGHKYSNTHTQKFATKLARKPTADGNKFTMSATGYILFYH